MGTFALDASSSSAEIVEGLNYAIANLGTSISSGLVANVLVANISTGEITTTSSNSSGYTNSTIVSYLYQYMGVKYANSSTGGSGFTSNSTMANYYGLRNSANTAISNNPVDYVWFQAAGGFGTTKSLWYQTIGGRQIDLFVGNAAPTASYIPVPDMPLSNSTPLNLDTVSSAQNNQIVNVNAFIQGNTAPATPAGGSYNFATYVLTPPTGWSSTIPTFVANTSIYVSQAAFVGNSVATVGPATLWSAPVVFSSQFQGNTGAPGERGFVPLGFVVTASDPTTFTNTDFTNAFQASRANPSPPIGLGYAPIAGDTAQFFYQNLFNPNLDVTIVRSYDGSVWSPVNAQVVSGGLLVPGTITANSLNANQVYAVTVQSTNANIGDNSSNGYWLQANTGNARFGGNLNIGNNLIVGANAQFGGNLNVTGLITQGNLGNSVVTSDNIQAAAITSVKIALAAVSGSQIAAATINGTNIAPDTITGNLIAANTITGNLITANTIQGSSIVAGSITADQLAANVLTVGNIVSTGATFDSPTSTGYWLNNVSGAVRFGGDTSIGNNLIVGQNAQVGANLNVGSSAKIGTNLTVGNNAIIGGFASIGSNVSIGGGLTVAGLITAGSLSTNTVNTTNIVDQAVSFGNVVTTVTANTVNNPNQTIYYRRPNCQPSITITGATNVYVTGVINVSYQVSTFYGDTSFELNYQVVRLNPGGSTTVVANSNIRYYWNSSGGEWGGAVPFAILDFPSSAGTYSYFYQWRVTTASSNVLSIPTVNNSSAAMTLQQLKR